MSNHRLPGFGHDYRVTNEKIYEQRHIKPSPAPCRPNQAHQEAGTVVYACSGCSDAGELADRIARRLTREGAAEMSCLAGIGGRVKSRS